MKEGMLCPVCKVTLAMMDRQGIEVDYCPQCRGVWLDRGELDKIVERSAFAAPDTAVPERRAAPSDYRAEHDYRSDERGYKPYDDDDRYERGHQPKRRRKGFLSDIFDFD